MQRQHWPSSWGGELLPERLFAEGLLTYPLEGIAYGGHPSNPVDEPTQLSCQKSDHVHFDGPGLYIGYLTLERWLEVRTEGRASENDLRNTLRVWTSYLLPTSHHGLMLHAASAIYREQGVVLAGLSGAGKSTFALGLDDATYLSDDISLVRDLSTSPWLLSSPFYGSAGKLGANESAPLRVFGILRQGPKTALRRLRAAEAAAQVMRHVVNFTTDASVCRAILEHVVALTERVPVFDVARSLETTSDELCDLLLRAAEEG